jgi:electron transfer flavoprotein beta subunit
MKLVVLMKQVPDTETKIRIGSSGKEIEAEGVSWVVNPYDEYAVEEALRIKEAQGASEVTVVTMGPGRSKEAMRTCLAMGADNAVHLVDPVFDSADANAAAKLVAKALEGTEYDLILCGKQAIDDDMAHVGPAVAEFLGLPHAALVIKLELDAGSKTLTCHRESDTGTEVLKMPYPAVITCQKGLNEPRYPSLPGIMKAKKKEIAEKTAADLGFDASTVEASIGTEVVSMTTPPARQAGKKIGGEPEDAAKELARLLSEEAKVI